MAQEHPRARFRRAIEGGWVFHAELAACFPVTARLEGVREIGRGRKG